MLLGPGSGTSAPLFEAPFYAHDMGIPLAYVVAADLNGDSRTDLVGIGQSSGVVAVALGLPDGGFGEVQFYGVSSGSSDPVIADLNGDDVLDIAIADFPSTTVGILLGNGDGTFSDTVQVAVGFQCYTVAAADLNGDSKLDLVAASYISVAVLDGNGDGTFGTPALYPTPTNVYHIAIGHMNADAAPDVITSGDGSQLSVLLNDGAGALLPYQGYTIAYGIGDLLAMDVTGDGATDVVIATSSVISVFPGDGNGAFLPRIDVTPPGASGLNRIAAGDLDGDSHVDLVASNGPQYYAYGNDVWVGFGDGAGAFPRQQVFESVYYTSDVVIADLDDDGVLDIGTSGTAGLIGLHLGNGDGSFGTSQTYSTGADPASIAVGDLDGDGAADMVVGHAGSASIGVRLGQGDGSFGLRRDYETNLVAPSAIAVGDVDGDGHADVVVADAPASARPGVAVFSGYADGEFSATAFYSMGIDPAGIAIGDLDGNGMNDLVVTDAVANRVSVLLNQGAGVFGVPAHYGAGGGATGVVVADMNGDHHPDVICANRGAGSVTLLFGAGDGGFISDLEIPTGLDCRAVAAGLADGDTIPDIVTANGAGGTLAVLLGLGGGAFTPAIQVDAGLHPTSICLADFDGDGAADVAFGSSEAPSSGPPSNLIGFALGDGNGNFEKRTLLGSSDRPESVAARDLDGDGLPDLLASSRYDEVVHVYRHPAPGVAAVPPPTHRPIALGPAWPNPTHGGIAIRFSVAGPGRAILRIFDVQGRLVRSFADGTWSPGEHDVYWDRRTSSGTLAPAGVYFCELTAGASRLGRRLVLL
jgi:FG-GAP-like repeat/FG-GAP repeat